MSGPVDSAGTELGSYRVSYSPTLSPFAYAENAPVLMVFNQGAIGVAGWALSVLGLMESSTSLIGDLSKAYESLFTRVASVFPPDILVGIALMLLLAWVFFERRANIRSMAADGNRIGLAFLIAIAVTAMARNPFALVEKVMTAFPSIVVDLLNGQSSQTATMTGFFMDKVVRPSLFLVMYGRVLNDSCATEWSKAMARGAQPECIAQLSTAPTGAMAAAVLLLIMFVVLFVFSVAALVMFVYFVTMTMWHWFVLMYVMAKALLDVRAIEAPKRQIKIAAGNTLCAMAVNFIAVAGPALMVVTMNSIAKDNPGLAAVLYLIGSAALLMILRQGIGALARKLGVAPNNGLVSFLVAPKAIVGAEAKLRRRQYLARGLDGVAAVAPLVPGGAAVSAAAAVAANKVRGSIAQANESEERRVSPEEVQRIEGALTPARSDTTSTGNRSVPVPIEVTPSGGAALPVPVVIGTGGAAATPPVDPGSATPPSATSAAVTPATGGAGTLPVLVEIPGAGQPAPTPAGAQQPAAAPEGAGRHSAPEQGSGQVAAEASPAVAAAGAARHLMASPPLQPVAPAASQTPTAPPAPARSAAETMAAAAQARRAAQRATRLDSRDRAAAADGVEVGSDRIEAARVDSAVRALNTTLRQYSAAPRQQIAPVPGMDALTPGLHAAVAAVQRREMRYLAAAAGIPTQVRIPESDPRRAVVMFHDGERNVVESAGVGSTLAPRI